MSGISRIVQSLSSLISSSKHQEEEKIKPVSSSSKDSEFTFGGRTEPYPGVPMCDERGRGNYYWIFKAKKGGWRLSTDAFPYKASWYRDPLPNEVPELHKRYQPYFERALSFNHDTTPAGILKTMQEHFETITMLARSGVCQAAWPDTKTCTSKDPTSCKKKYMLLFKHALNGHTMTELAQQKITYDHEEGRRQQGRMLQTMPPSMRKCHFSIDTSVAPESFRRNAEKFNDAEAVNTDWTMIEAMTKEVMRDVDKALPSLDEEYRRHVMNVIKMGQEAGMADHELKEVVYDLSMVSAGDEPFIRALETVASLRFALMLHRKHKQKGGSGISEDFERFVGTSIDNVRSGRIKFSVMNLQAQMDQAAASYNPWSNTVNFSPLCPNADPMGQLSTVVHEMYHSYQDFMKRQQSTLDNEAEAYERHMKTEILLRLHRESAPEKSFYVPDYEDVGWLQEDMQKAQALNTKCMGMEKELLELKEEELWRSKLGYLASSGFEDELDGIASPYASELIKEAVLLNETQRFFNRTLDDSYRPAWLFDHGFDFALVDLFLSSDDEVATLGTFLNRMITDKVLPYETLLATKFKLIRAVTLASSAMYYVDRLRGDAKLKEWRSYANSFGRLYGYALEELGKNRKAFNDGVAWDH